MNGIQFQQAQSMPAHKRALSRREVLILCCAVAIYLASSAAVSWTRAPLGDEAFYASAAYNLYAHGFMGTTVYEPVGSPFPGLEHHTYTYPPLHTLMQVGWYKLFGFGLFQMRMTSTLWGLLLLGSWFVIVRQLAGSSGPAVLAVCLLSVDYTVQMTASLGRMSMMSAALGFAALAAYLHFRERNLNLALIVSQACAVASGLTHPLGGILAVPSLIMLTLVLDRGRLRGRHLGYVVLPYLVGMVGWGIYILDDSALFWTQFAASATQGHRLAGLASPWHGFLDEIRIRYLGYYGLTTAGVDPRILFLIAYVAGIVLVAATPAVRRHRGYRILFLLFVLQFVIMSLFEGSKQRLYLIHAIPFMLAFLAIWIYWAFVSGKAMPAIAVVTGFVLLQVSMVGYRIALNPYKRDYMPVIEYLRPLARGDTRMVGPIRLLFGLGFDTHLVFDPVFGMSSGRTSEVIVLDADFRSYLEAGATSNSKIGTYVQEKITHYRKVFGHGEYEVYVLADSGATKAPPFAPPHTEME